MAPIHFFGIAPCRSWTSDCNSQFHRFEMSCVQPTTILWTIAIGRLRFAKVPPEESRSKSTQWRPAPTHVLQMETFAVGGAIGLRRCLVRSSCNCELCQSELIWRFDQDEVCRVRPQVSSATTIVAEGKPRYPVRKNRHQRELTDSLQPGECCSDRQTTQLTNTRLTP